MKKFFAMLLSTAVMFLAVPVSAGSGPPPASVDGIIEEMTENAFTVASEEGETLVVLNITPQTNFADAETGLPAAESDFEVGDRVIAHYGPVTTMSLPPQSNALLILGNIPETGIVPQFGRAEAVEREGDEITVTVLGGSLLVTLTSDVLEPFMTRQNVTIDHIEPGADLLMWYAAVALSEPARATATRAVLLSRGSAPSDAETAEELPAEGRGNGTVEFAGDGEAETGEAEEPTEETPEEPATEELVTEEPVTTESLTEEPVTEEPVTTEPVLVETPDETASLPLAEALNRAYGDFRTENGVTMAPLRRVAEDMGFSVTWNDATRSVTMSHGDGQAFGTVVIGQGSFEGNALQAAPLIINERTFVPVSFFEILLGMQ